MLFLLGLFLGCAFGFIVACLCNIAREKTSSLSTESGSPEVMEGTA
jgi:predicted outer membrane lipoprotein